MYFQARPISPPIEEELNTSQDEPTPQAEGQKDSFEVPPETGEEQREKGDIKFKVITLSIGINGTA